MNTKPKHLTFNGQTTWFTADLHLGHRGILRMEGRPFTSVEEMNESLILAWNSRVRASDDVFFLGDFAMNFSEEQCQEAFAKLKGKKHLIVGNHDKERVLKLPWASEPVEQRSIRVDGTRVVLNHYGMRTWNGMWKGALHLYGHSHGKLPGTTQSCDVGVDAWAYRPVRLAEIRERLAETTALPDERMHAAEPDDGE